jgi:hypothetical protein
MQPSPGGGGTISARTDALLDLDPELGLLLDDEGRASAHRELRVRTSRIAVGEWDVERLAEVAPTHVGLLMVGGVMARHVSLLDTVSTELLGPGDVLRPWRLDDAPSLLEVETRWNALSPVRVALLDAHTAATLGRYPELTAVLVDRLVGRSKRLAVTQAISQLTRVEDRLVALFWHLAERWGRVSPAGVVLPLALSHRLVGELIGARRPTVSTALSNLSRAGRICRRPDGTWLLTGEAAGVTTDRVEVIQQRRALIPETRSARLTSLGAAL